MTPAERTCPVDGCGKPSRPTRRDAACSMHATRMQRHGSFANPRMSTEERALSNIDADGDCWLWQGAIGVGGYGYFAHQQPGRGRINSRAHRYIYELLVRRLTEDEQIDHLCRVRHCVNPDHLEPVSAKENIARSYGVARQLRERRFCSEGHEFNAENTAKDGRGRRCRPCRNQNQRLRRNARKESANA